MGAATFTIRYEDLLAATRLGAGEGRWRRRLAWAALPGVALATVIAVSGLRPDVAAETALSLGAVGWMAAVFGLLPLLAGWRLPRRVRRQFARQPETALLTTLAWREAGLVLASPRGTVRLGWDEVSVVERGELLLFRRRDGGTPLFVPLHRLSAAQRGELRTLGEPSRAR
ncbi:hypothetical protein ACMGDM_17265 [Sphingomonas sp. DT-51]|uniref:hypothetical protein n=1 Tax=Sphingomonas sp. DT-51 TaxID=3396165 RepID=UPI003F1D7BCE